MTKEAARALTNEAREKMLDVEFDQGHSKTGMSGERYDRYKSLTKMQEVLDAETEPFTYRNGRTGTVMLRGDLQHDVEKGIAMIKGGAGGYLAAAAMFEEAPARRGVQKLMDAGVIEHDDEWYGAAKGWGRGSEVPVWYAMAAKARTMVVIDGMVEPNRFLPRVQTRACCGWAQNTAMQTKCVHKPRMSTHRHAYIHA